MIAGWKARYDGVVAYQHHIGNFLSAIDRDISRCSGSNVTTHERPSVRTAPARSCRHSGSIIAGSCADRRPLAHHTHRGQPRLGPHRPDQDMTGMATGSTIRTKQGALRGERGERYVVFRNVPYAAAAERRRASHRLSPRRRGAAFATPPPDRSPRRTVRASRTSWATSSGRRVRIVSR